MAEVGRDTLLTDEVLRKIKKCILDGKNLKETASVCEINVDTVYNWTTENYLNLATLIDDWKRDRKVMLASDNVEEILTMDTNNIVIVGEETYTKKDSGLVRIKSDMSQFVLETLGKDKGYTKKTETDQKTELSTKDNKPLNIKIETVDDANNVISNILK